MKILVASLSLCLFCSALVQASAGTGVTCSAARGNTGGGQNGPSPCELGPLFPYAIASASSTLTSTVVPRQVIPFDSYMLTNTGFGQAQTLTPDAIYASAQETAVAQEFLETLGPVRPGYILFSGLASDWTASAGQNSNSLNLSIGSLSGACSGGNAPTCTGLFAASNGSPVLIPYTLGQLFTLNYRNVFLATATPSNPTASSGGTVTFSFEFFEADGTTVAPMASIPEPGTLGYLSLVVTGAVVLYRRKRVLSR